MKRLKKILRWGAISLGFVIAALLVVGAIMNAIWGAELRKTIAEIKARGEPMTIAEIIPPYVPPEQNAVVELNKAFALMCGDKPEERYIPFKQGKLKTSVRALNDFQQKMGQASAEETKKNLELVDSPEFMEIFNALNTAALKPECNFDLKYEDGFMMKAPNHGLFFRTAARLLSVRAISQAKHGDIDDACHTIITAIKISNHLRNEPLLITQIVKTFSLTIVLDALNNIMDNYQISEETNKNLLAELDKIDTIEPFKKSFIAEVDYGQSIFNGFISGQYKYNDFAELFAGAAGPDSHPASGSRLFYCILKTFLKKDYCEYLQVMTLYPAVCSKPFYVSKAQLKEIETNIWHIPRYCILSCLLSPNLTKVIENNAAFQTRLAISKVKLALVIYKGKNGAFPENLEQLKPEILKEIPIDELTGNPLTYKKEGEKHVLFSAAVQKLEEERKLEREKSERAR